MNLRTFVATSFASVFCLGLAARAESAPPLRLASWEWAPFSGSPGEPHVAVDLVHEALRRAGFSATSTALSNAEVEAALKQGTFQGSECAWQSKEREAYLIYSAPYLENRLVLVGRKGADLSAKTLGDLAGKKVAITANYAYGDEVKGATNVAFVEGTDLAANLKSVVKGEADYTLVDELVIQHLFGAKSGPHKLAAGVHPLVTRSLHFVVRKDVKQAATIIERFNEQLRRMLADGSYNRLLGVGWVRADADGDGKSELILAGNQAGTDAPVRAYAVGEASKEKVERLPAGFFIEGKRYEDWSQIPNRYKVPMTGGLTPVYRGITVFEF